MNCGPLFHVCPPLWTLYLHATGDDFNEIGGDEGNTPLVRAMSEYLPEPHCSSRDVHFIEIVSPVPRKSAVSTAGTYILFLRGECVPRQRADFNEMVSCRIKGDGSDDGAGISVLSD